MDRLHNKRRVNGARVAGAPLFVVLVERVCLIRVAVMTTATHARGGATRRRHRFQLHVDHILSKT